jgi:hypothetical protein
MQSLTNSAERRCVSASPQVSGIYALRDLRCNGLYETLRSFKIRSMQRQQYRREVPSLWLVALYPDLMYSPQLPQVTLLTHMVL